MFQKIILCLTKAKVLLSSPRNSVEGHLSLIRQSGCQLWMTSSGIGNLEFCQKLQLHCLQIPHLDELLGSSAVKPYPYNKEWQDGRSDVLALLHTTGSTGLPRLLPLTLESVSSGDALNAVETIQGKLPSLVEWAGTKMLCAMPLFHVSATMWLSENETYRRLTDECFDIHRLLGSALPWVVQYSSDGVLSFHLLAL